MQLRFSSFFSFLFSKVHGVWKLKSHLEKNKIPSTNHTKNTINKNIVKIKCKICDHEVLKEKNGKITITLELGLENLDSIKERVYNFNYI